MSGVNLLLGDCLDVLRGMDAPGKLAQATAWAVAPAPVPAQKG